MKTFLPLNVFKSGSFSVKLIYCLILQDSELFNGAML